MPIKQTPNEALFIYMTAKSRLFINLAQIATEATASIAATLANSAVMYSDVEPDPVLVFSPACESMIIPMNEITIAIMSMLDMVSLRNKRDITATAKGEQAMITVPIESGSTLNA